ncbi:transmembrane protein 44 isoform X2 [Hyla sarda]|uniref:transmembrane protein 44 isoform X2 n=1 Tax=Hyla sarda TaxID=327740 RepID=UPI0024C2C7AA|nr:transmembrane protein 44 isoform X2 [Hyla sarda]
MTLRGGGNMDRVENSTEKEHQDPGLWNLDDLITCFAEEKICVSFGLWLLSSLFWFTSFSLHFFLRCKRKSSYEESVFWSIYAFFGSVCNTIGALLSRQLTIQIITGAYMALSDVVHFVLTLFPACNSRYRIRLQRQQNSRRKYKPVLSALSLSILISLGCCYSLEEKDLPPYELPHPSRRRLLGTMLQCKGLMFPVLHVWTVLFSALASLMYAAAIMSHDRRPEYFVKAIPWLLISVGSAALDIALLFLSCIMKNKLVQQMGLVLDATLDEENCELLAEEELKARETNAEISNWTPLNMVPNRCISSKVSLGRYVRLSVEQVQENDNRAVRLPGDGQTNPGHVNQKEPPCYLDLSVYPPPRITHYTSSPSSSSDASSNTTDLEWDFEDLDQNWNKNSDFLSIQPNDSSVLKAINICPDQPFPSTIYPGFKSLELITSYKKTPADSTKMEQN